MQQLTYSVQEAADLLGIHRITLYRAIRRGDVQVVRIGGAIRVSQTTLAGLLHTSPGLLVEKCQCPACSSQDTL